MTTTPQERFWREMDQLKIHSIYIDLYYEKTVSIDRLINITLALSSSGAVAGWAVWKEFSITWSIIVAGSQVLNAIRSHLPYSRRMRSLNLLATELDAIFLAMESNWFNISEGNIGDDAVNKLHMKFKEQLKSTVHRTVGTIDIPHNESLAIKANEIAALYFQNFWVSQDEQ